MRKLLTIIAGILILLNTGDAFAGVNTTLEVTATVLPVVKYSILHKESRLIVTQEDLDRGYIDIQRALIFSVKTNSFDGYLLTFSVGSDIFSGLTVVNENNVYKLSGSEFEIHMPFQGMNYITKELNIRFHLLSDAKPGTYEWPLSFMITAM
jgi:hypothetical protein